MSTLIPSQRATAAAGAASSGRRGEFAVRGSAAAARERGVLEPDTRPLSEYRAAARRHRRALAWFLVAGLVGAAINLVWFGGDYRATTSVVMTDPATLRTAISQDRLGVNLSMDTEVQLLGSPAVLRPAAERLGISPEELAERTSVTVPANTRILDIHFSADSAARAKAGSEAIAETFLDVRTEQNDARRTAIVGQVTSILEALLGQSRELTEISENRGASWQRRAEAARQARSLEETILRQRRRLAELRMLNTSAGAVTQHPVEARGPRLADRMVPIASGLALGLVGWAALVPLLGRWRRVRSEDDAAALPGVSVALEVPADPEEGRAALLRWWGYLLVVVRSTPRTVLVLGADGSRAARESAVEVARASAGEGLATALVCIGPPPWPLLRGLGMDAVPMPEATEQPIAVLGSSPHERHLDLAMIAYRAGLPLEAAITEALAELGAAGYTHLVVVGPPPGGIGRAALARVADLTVLAAARRHTRMQALTGQVRELLEARAAVLHVLIRS